MFGSKREAPRHTACETIVIDGVLYHNGDIIRDSKGVIFQLYRSPYAGGLRDESTPADVVERQHWYWYTFGTEVDFWIDDEVPPTSRGGGPHKPFRRHWLVPVITEPMTLTPSGCPKCGQ